MSLKSRNMFLPVCAIILIIACAFAGCSSSQSAPPATPTQPTIQQVNIDNSGFNPNYLQVRSGTIVNWTNTDKYIHSISSDFIGEKFNSPTLNPGQSYQHTYIQLGRQPYFDGISHANTGIVNVVK